MKEKKKPKVSWKNRPYGAIIDTYDKRILICETSGRKLPEIQAKLDELAAKLKELAPSHEFRINQNSECVFIKTPMPSDEMLKLFMDAATACGCILK